VFSIIRRDTAFFDLFEEAAKVVLKAAETYARVADDYGNRDAHIAEIRQLEHAGDEITHRTLDKLDKTFITPFDREDIQALMMQMDDVIDEIDAASKRLTLYKIDEPTDWLVKQTNVLVRATRLVGQAVASLRNLKKPASLQAQLVEIHRLENEGDDNNHAAAAELFNTSADPILVMKWKEIYDLTERAIDGCEDIANTIEAIILKNT
jgi:predicted phosphate transport protein (TIGR00153 family)